MVVFFNLTGKNRWNVRVDNRVVARISPRKGSLAVSLTRSANSILLECITFWIETQEKSLGLGPWKKLAA